MRSVEAVMYVHNNGRKHPFVGIGFGVYVLVAPCVFLFTWLLGSLHAAIAAASWVGLAGVLLGALGALLSRVTRGYYVSYLVQVLAPVTGLTYVHSHGYAWLWTAGWMAFGLSVLQLVPQLVVTRRPSMFSFEYARQLLINHYSVPPLVRALMTTLQSFAVAGLGIFLLGSSIGYGGVVVIGPLFVAIVAGLLNSMLIIHHRRQLMRQQ